MGRTPTGTIRKLPSGRWQVRYWTIGGRRITSRRTFPSKTDAHVWLSSAVVDRASGVRSDPRSQHMTLDRYSETWLAGRNGLVSNSVYTFHTWTAPQRALIRAVFNAAN